jgi:hypothetical protein
MTKSNVKGTQTRGAGLGKKDLRGNNGLRRDNSPYPNYRLCHFEWRQLYLPDQATLAETLNALRHINSLDAKWAVFDRLKELGFEKLDDALDAAGWGRK